jgi:hypothetical protein
MFMGSWFFSLLFRAASGERFRKATSVERRWYGGFFVFLPVFLFSFAHFGHSFLGRASPIGIWFYMMGGVLVLGICLFVWARYIPAIVSLILGVVVWAVIIWMLFTGRLI